jgi:hypothetical protein
VVFLPEGGKTLPTGEVMNSDRAGTTHRPSRAKVVPAIDVKSPHGKIGELLPLRMAA